MLLTPILRTVTSNPSRLCCPACPGLPAVFACSADPGALRGDRLPAWRRTWYGSEFGADDVSVIAQSLCYRKIKSGSNTDDSARHRCIHIGDAIFAEYLVTSSCIKCYRMKLQHGPFARVERYVIGNQG